MALPLQLSTFDSDYYLQHNPDVLAAVRNGVFTSAWEHYVMFGEGEGRMPNSVFAPAAYLAGNPDVLAAIPGFFSTALQHFEQYGVSEGRFPGTDLFDEESYINDPANSDVKAAVEAGVFSSGFQHYILHGQEEGRAPGVASPDLTLTDGIDLLTASIPNATFAAPVVQNALGAVTNTFETGDVLTGVGGVNVLRADLITTFANGIFTAPVTSATTNDIQQVFFRAQYPQDDGLVNVSTIDAEKMFGVEQWWSDNSRTSVQIEDIRSIPEVTTFGMRETDAVPGNGGVGAGLFAYFSPDAVSGDRLVQEDSSLTLILVDAANPTSLEGFPVNGVVFDLNDETFTVGLDLGTGTERTYENLVVVINEGLAADPALARLTAVLNADNSVTITDPAGGTFVPKGYTWIDDIVPPAGGLNWDLIAGAPTDVEVPTETAVVLDFVGRTSQGGSLDIGSMADGGVNVFNVTVDRESWLTSMQSRSDLGDDGKQNLETVNLASTGANGDLAVGFAVGNEETGWLDGLAYDGVNDPRVRVYDGLTDVRTVDGSDFAGRLNLGLLLTEESISRYLDTAAGEVEFNYTASAQNDIFTFEVSGVLSQDPDFAMNIAMGAGDDRLNLADAIMHGDASVLAAKNIMVDGGLGANTIAVNSSFGTTANNTFEGFARFQTYEIEGGNNTEQGFTSLPGVTAVVIATDDSAADTALIDLPVTLVTVDGKNQTLGTNSNSDQLFGTISVLGSDAVALDVKLQNTARVDGELNVESLTFADQSSSNQSAVRTVDLESAGRRDTVNSVDEVFGGKVNTFNLSGTQGLYADIVSAANSTATSAAARGSFVVDASELTGALDLQVNAAIMTVIDATAGKTNTLTGTDGDADLLTFYGSPLTTTANTTISEFETVVFGREFDATSGSFDGTKVTDVSLYDVAYLDDELIIDKMDGSETVHINTDDGAGTQDNDLTLVAASRATTNTLSVEYSDSTPGGDDTNFVSSLFIQDFRTISIDLGGDADLDDAYLLNPVLLNAAGEVPLTNSALPADLATTSLTVYADTMVFTGGGDQGALGADDGVDSLELVDPLSTALSVIDFSDYVGQVTAALGTSAGTTGVGNTTVIVNGYGLTFEQADPNAVITTYQFTTDAVADGEVWSITGFRDFTGATLSDLSILDLTDLGVSGFADLTIEDVGGTTRITSDGDLNFQIELVGVASGDLTNENFAFAA